MYICSTPRRNEGFSCTEGVVYYTERVIYCNLPGGPLQHIYVLAPSIIAPTLNAHPEYIVMGTLYHMGSLKCPQFIHLNIMTK